MNNQSIKLKGLVGDACNIYNGCFKQPSTSAPLPLPDACTNPELLKDKQISSICSCPATANTVISDLNDNIIKKSYNDWCSDAITAYNNDLVDYKNLTGRFAYLKDTLNKYKTQRMELNDCVITFDSASSLTDRCNNDAKNRHNLDTNHGGYVWDNGFYYQSDCVPLYYKYFCQRTDSQAEYDFRNSDNYKSLEPKTPCTQISLPSVSQTAMECCVNIIQDINASKIENVKQECNQKIVQQIDNIISSNTTTPSPTSPEPTSPEPVPELQCKFLFKPNDTQTECVVNSLYIGILIGSIFIIFICLMYFL